MDTYADGKSRSGIAVRKPFYEIVRSASNRSVAAPCRVVNYGNQYRQSSRSEGSRGGKEDICALAVKAFFAAFPAILPIRMDGPSLPTSRFQVFEDNPINFICVLPSSQCNGK